MRAQALLRASIPKGRTASHPPPPHLLYSMQQIPTYKGRGEVGFSIGAKTARPALLLPEPADGCGIVNSSLDAALAALQIPCRSRARCPRERVGQAFTHT